MNRKRMFLRFSVAACFFLTVLFLSPFVFAGGGGHIPLGDYSDPMVGISPPPGFYFTEYLAYYTAGKLKDNKGRTLSLTRDGEELNQMGAYASGNRILWMSNFKILGLSYGAQFVVPVERINMSIKTFTPSFSPLRLGQGEGGVGDIYFNPCILAWHEKHGLLHITTGVDITEPTSSYRRDALVTIGQNSWTIMPAVQMTIFVPWVPKITVGFRSDYSFNTKNYNYIINANTAANMGNMALTGLRTGLTPGQEFHTDYAASYCLTPLGQDPMLSVGVQGYYYQQTTNDRTGFGKIMIDKGRVFAVGPGASFNYKKLNVGLRWSIETEAKNRTEGDLFLSTITYTF